MPTAFIVAARRIVAVLRHALDFLDRIHDGVSTDRRNQPKRDHAQQAHDRTC